MNPQEQDPRHSGSADRREDREPFRRRPQCGAHRLRQAHVPPQRRSHPPPAHRSGEELPQLQNPQAQPGRRRLRGDADDPPGGLVAITDNADPMDAVVYRTATRLRHHQHRVVARCRCRQERKRQRELTDQPQPLTERRKQLRLPGPIRPPHRCDHTAPASRGSTSTSTSTAAGWCGQTTPRAPQRGYQSSPRQPRQDRALGASASGRGPADVPMARRRRHRAYLLRRSAAISHGRVKQLLPVIAATRSVLGAHQICGRNSARHVPARARMRVSPNAQVASRNSPEPQPPSLPPRPRRTPRLPRHDALWGSWDGTCAESPSRPRLARALCPRTRSSARRPGGRLPWRPIGSPRPAGVSRR